MLKKLIFVPTVQSTGTWFLLNFFKEHPRVSWVAPKAEWDNDRLKKEQGVCVYQVHFGIASGSGSKAFIGKRELLDKWMDIARCIVIPVRDPLRSLLTAYVRRSEEENKKQPIDHIVNGFLDIAGMVKTRKIFILPVDLYGKRALRARKRILTQLLRFTKLEMEDYVDTWAEEWPVHNTVGERLGGQVNRLYVKRRVERIKELIPDEYGKLVKARDILQPFMQELGYKDLIWWDGQ